MTQSDRIWVLQKAGVPIRREAGSRKNRDGDTVAFVGYFIEGGALQWQNRG